MRSKITFTALAVAALIVQGGAAQAADALTDAMQSAYTPYRAALFKTNAKAQADSEQAIADARAQWRALSQRYAASAPVPYDRDAEFAATLKKVDEVLARAEAQIRAGDLATGHETLEAVRDLLGELRRRNGVVVYSDHMNAYHAEMERLLVDAPAQLSQPGGMLAVAGQAAVLDYLARRLKQEAPPDLVRNADFGGLVDAVLSSVTQLRAAIARQDAAAVRDAVGKVKGPYSRLFVRFG
jgi:hypothetical protein